MKHLFVIVVLLSMSFSAKAAGVWAESSFGEKPDTNQDEVIRAELDDEIQEAAGLKVGLNHRQAAKVQAAKQSIDQEAAVAQLGSEMDAAEAKVHEAEVADRVATRHHVRTAAHHESKPKLAHLKFRKMTKGHPAKYGYFRKSKLTPLAFADHGLLE